MIYLQTMIQTQEALPHPERTILDNLPVKLNSVAYSTEKNGIYKYRVRAIGKEENFRLNPIVGILGIWDYLVSEVLCPLRAREIKKTLKGMYPHLKLNV